MVMSRAEILRIEREKVLINLAKANGNRAKWLVMLMDIDEEMEEIVKKNKGKAC